MVGLWRTSPFGPFADVMVEGAPGAGRLLIAPPDVAEFVATTYHFEQVVTAPVRAHGCRGGRGVSTRLRVVAGPLRLDAEIGRRTPLGWALRTLPRGVATAPTWARLIAPVSSVVMPGVRTWGSAGSCRWEAYGAWDHHAVLRIRGSWHGTDIGDLAPLDPPVRFGFGSAPRTPSLTSLTTTVLERA